MIRTAEFEIAGDVPLLMKNGQLADPGNKWAIEIAKLPKGNKQTEKDRERRMELLWYGSLYHRSDKDLELVIPEINIEQMVIEGGRCSSKGMEITRYVTCPEAPALLINAKGNGKLMSSSDVDRLWASHRFEDRRLVVISKKRVMGIRPRFDEWGLRFKLNFNEMEIDPMLVVHAVVEAGNQKGLGDFRPRFGRFHVETVDGLTLEVFEEAERDKRQAVETDEEAE